MRGTFGSVLVARSFASSPQMMKFRDFLFTEHKDPSERIILPDEIGGELKLTQVRMLEVEVDGKKIDGAFVSLRDAIIGAIRAFMRVWYLTKHVSR
jgi:hypothetical protein